MQISYPQNDAIYPLQLECPCCGHRTVVTRAEHHYVCLNCHWQRNLSWGGIPNPGERPVLRHHPIFDGSDLWLGRGLVGNLSAADKLKLIAPPSPLRPSPESLVSSALWGWRWCAPAGEADRGLGQRSPARQIAV